MIANKDLIVQAMKSWSGNITSEFVNDGTWIYHCEIFGIKGKVKFQLQ